jgi:hypothetical protein
MCLHFNVIQGKEHYISLFVKGTTMLSLLDILEKL